jgi:hypothetical protein
VQPEAARYPFSVTFDGQPTPARIGGAEEMPGLYLDLGTGVEHLIAGSHPLLEVVGRLSREVVQGLIAREFGVDPDHASRGWR